MSIERKKPNLPQARGTADFRGRLSGQGAGNGTDGRGIASASASPIWRPCFSGYTQRLQLAGYSTEQRLQ